MITTIILVAIILFILFAYADLSNKESIARRDLERPNRMKVQDHFGGKKDGWL